MMARRILLALALVAAMSPAVAGPQHLQIINQQCGTQLGKPPAVCNCMSQRAGSQLSENQQAFMAAQVTGNAPEIGRTQATLSANDALGVMQFMTTIIAACGG